MPWDEEAQAWEGQWSQLSRCPVMAWACAVGFLFTSLLEGRFKAISLLFTKGLLFPQPTHTLSLRLLGAEGDGASLPPSAATWSKPLTLP